MRSGAAEGQEWARYWAATALKSLACNDANRAAIVAAGAVDQLISIVRDRRDDDVLKTAAAEALEQLDLAAIASRLEAPECVVCLQRAREVAFVPCGHFCVCSNCGQRLSECPICQESTRKQRIYT